jgi:hypothetical protein
MPVAGSSPAEIQIFMKVTHSWVEASDVEKNLTPEETGYRASGKDFRGVLPAFPVPAAVSSQKGDSICGKSQPC